MATLFVSEDCGMCRAVGQWFRRRGARGLTIVAAESTSLARVDANHLRARRWQPGCATVSGAVARALEHVHLGWAMIGFLLRVPIVSAVAQLLADASGAEPRKISCRSASS